MQIPHKAGKTTTTDRRSIHRVALFFCLAVLAKYLPARTVEPVTGQTPAPSPTSSCNNGAVKDLAGKQIFDAAGKGPGLGKKSFE
jgi:hypothetical protein